MEYSKTRSILSNDIKGGGIQDVVVYQRLCSCVIMRSMYYYNNSYVLCPSD